MKGHCEEIQVCVVVPPRVLLLDVAGPIEVLRRANLEQDAVRFVVRYASPSTEIMSSIGLPLSGLASLPVEVPDNAFIVLPGTADNVAFATDAPDEHVRRQEAAIVAWLEESVNATHTLVSICSGALLAARAGLLDGHACTTHHTACKELASIAPKSKVLDNRLFVVDGRRCSSAGITAGTDLMLHLVSGYVGHPCAVRIARHLVLYVRREGSDPQISPWLDGRNHIHPAVHRVQDAISANPTRDWTLERLAKLASTSPRHLSRLFNEHAGMSIVEYVNGLRVSLARELLQGSRLDMERIAERSGFGSARQLRRAWRKKYEQAPNEARREG